MIENGLIMYFLEGDLELYTTVLLTTLFGGVRLNRLILSVTDSGHSLCFHTLVDQVVTHSFCTVLRQFQVRFRFTYVIRVTLKYMI